MTTPVGMPNYQQLYGTQAGIEVTRGTSTTKTNKWYGKFELARHQPLAESDEYAGTFFTDYTPVRGAVTVDGTYTQHMSYEDPHLFRYAVAGGGTPTDDGATTHGYTHSFQYSPTVDNLDTVSVECLKGGMIWESQGLMFPEFTISADIDDPQAVWKWSSRVLATSMDLKTTGALDDVAATSGSTTTFVKTAWAQSVNAHVGKWVHFKTGTAANIGMFRQVISNDATTLTFAALPSAVASSDTIDVYAIMTSGISDRTREMIKGPGTVLYMDASGGTIGTTAISGRLISFSVTGQYPATYKRFLENTTTTSNKLDLGMRRISGQFRLEFDRKREWDKYKALTPELVRIKQTGTTIDSGTSTTKTAIIDLYNVVYDDPTVDVRGNNVTATWPWRAYVGASQGVQGLFSIKNVQSSLLV